MRWVLVALASVVPALALSIKGKVSVSTTDGTDKTYSLADAPHIDLEPSSTWKLNFNLDDQAVQLNQAHLLFEDQVGKNDVTYPVTIKKGKGGFTINTAKTPSSLLASNGKFALTLHLSTLDDALSTPLGSISLPSSTLKPLPRGRHDLPPRQGEPAFQPEPEIFHTFQPEPKQVGSFKSAIGVGLVIVPWALLALLHGKVAPVYKGISGSSAIFLLSLLSLESLIFVYWLQLKLYQFLPIFLPLSVVAAYTGKVALSRK